MIGLESANKGYSIHYNPFRNKNLSDQFLEWKRGWLVGFNHFVNDKRKRK